MHIDPLHAWDLSPKDAIKLQNELAEQLISDAPLDLRQIRLVAGVDVSVKNDISQAAVVVMSYPSLDILEVSRAQLPTTYPYVPGLLTFREGQVLVQAFEQLAHTPDVFIFDGMGQIHPRRMGIAAHMGLWLKRPTIGVGKTHLIGEYAQPAAEKGSYEPVMYKGQQLGVILRTRTNVKPVYVSVGHLTNLQSAIELIDTMSPKYRLPIPIRAAHKAAGEYEDHS